MSDQFATKADLTDVETRLKADLTDVETRLKADLTDVETRLLERLEKVETTLLKEFHKWAQITETRIRVNEMVAFGLSDRVTSLESRVRDLEQKHD
jgi:hypothetical protein